jgi:hypothetical protein
LLFFHVNCFCLIFRYSNTSPSTYDRST